jgi:hypothetical protein
MNGLFRSIPALCIAGVLCVSQNQMQAQTSDFVSRDVDLVLTAAFLLPSDNISAEDYGIKLHQNGTFLGRIAADFFLIPKMSMGVYMNVSPVSYGESDETATVLEFGGSLKGRFLVAHGAVAVKMGANVGYRYISSKLKYSDGVSGFSIGPSIEVQFATGTSLAPHIEIGFLSQPAGGNEYTNITFPPIFYVGGGCSLGL